MKKIITKIKDFYNRSAFTRGFLLATVLSTSLTFAVSLATNGLYIFEAGDILSADQLNHNFDSLETRVVSNEAALGEVVFKANNTSQYTYTVGNANQTCNSYANTCYAGFAPIDNIDIGSADTIPDQSVSTAYSSTFGSNVSYYTIPESGFYSISLIGKVSDFTIPNYDIVNGIIDFNFNLIATTFDPAANGGPIIDPTSTAFLFNGATIIDYSDVVQSLIYASWKMYAYDTGDAIYTSDEGSPSQITGTRKTLYYNAGDSLALLYRVKFGNSTQAPASITVPAGGIEISIRKL